MPAMICSYITLLETVCWLSNNNHVTDSLVFLDHRLCPTEKTPVLICLARLFGDIALKVSNDQTSSDPTT
jgi:hypothetical protein